MELSVGVVVYGNSVYVETIGNVGGQGRRFRIIEPVYKVDFDVAILTKTLEQTRQVGNPVVPWISDEELARSPHPTVVVTGAKDVNHLYQVGVVYEVTWHTDKIRVVVWRSRYSGLRIWDRFSGVNFPPDAPTLTIAETILKDAAARGFPKAKQGVRKKTQKVRPSST